MTLLGHLEAFRSRQLNAGSVIRKPTFAGTHGNGRDAPKPVIELTAVELLEGDSWRTIRMQQRAVLRLGTERARKGARLPAHLIAR
jgi:hypothetical protein